jgi:hypothetical protein
LCTFPSSRCCVFYFSPTSLLYNKLDENQPSPSEQLLQQPPTEFFYRLSAPTNLSKTFNRLVSDTLGRGNTIQPSEQQDIHSLLDFLLAYQLLSGAAFVVAEA